MESHLKHLDENVEKFTNGTFLTFPADMEACSPELKEAYAALRRTLLELCKHYTSIFFEAENRMNAGKAVQTSMVKPLEDATTCKGALEMWVDIMKSYTEVELDAHARRYRRSYVADTQAL
jgi:hypothetical protein